MLELNETLGYSVLELQNALIGASNLDEYKANLHKLEKDHETLDEIFIKY